MGITVLGPSAQNGSGRLGPRERVVLQALTTRPGHPVSADELLDALWGDQPPASAVKNLQGCVSRLRKVLGADTITTTDHGYVLTVPPDEIDAQRFEQLVDRARALLTLGEADRVAFLLAEALSAWRGAPFPDLPDWPPARREASRLEELRLEAEELRVDALLRSGRPREVLGAAHSMVRAAPLRERRWTLLALAQYQVGSQGEALRTIHQLRSVLSHQLGIDPGPDVQALEQAILRQDPGLLTAALATPQTQCPWQGLRPYDVSDADRFFGRRDDITECVDRVLRTSFLALVGPSGSGKSSILRAGVLAALRARGLPGIVITPGRHPLEALSALDQAPSASLLAVDQCEETFSLCEDAQELHEFLLRLTHEAQQRPVLVAIRADRLADVTAHPGFSHLVERGMHLVGALDEEGLRAAVEEPARQAGLLVEPGLVDLLVREVQDDPGALPLLSHALLETWKRREGNTLTVDGYRASGGIRGAVAQSAERLYAEVDPDQRNLLRDLVLRLVSPGTQGEPVRSRIPRRLIAADDAHDRLVEMLVGARLVTSDDGVLEITHEALARAWPRLRGWLDDDIEGQRTLHHLSAAADAWATLGRPDSELYRGVRLTRALDWQARTPSALTDAERDFLSAAEAAAQDEALAAARAARAQARLIRRLRIVLGGATVLLVLALVAGILAAVQSDRANENAARAQQSAVSADARRVGARAQLTDDIGLSLLLAAAGARLDDSPETRVNLLNALGRRPNLVRSAPAGGGYLEVFSVSPDGRWIASSDDQNRMHLYDAATNRLLLNYDAGRPAEGEQTFMLGTFSPDSRRLAVILEGEGSTEPVRLLDPNTMRPATKLDFPADKPVWGSDVGFSADGRYLAATVQTVSYLEDSSESPGYAVVWDLRSPSTPPIRVPTGNGLQGLALSPDGRTLYTGQPLTAYEVATGEQIWRRKEVSTHYTALDVNAEGTQLALERHGPCRGKDGLLVSASTGATVHTLRGQRGPACDIRFSPDGTLVGSVSLDGELIVWDTDTGRPLERWHTLDPWGVGFGPDNDLVYGGGADSMLRTWDLSGEETYLQQTTQVGDVPLFANADFSPDGQQVAYRWVDDTGEGWVTFVDTATGEATTPTELPTQSPPWSLGTWHPNGRQYVGWCALDAGPCREPGVVTVLDSTTGEVVGKEDLFDEDIHSVAYVDGGRSVLVGNSDRQTSIFDPETLLPKGDAFDYVANVAIPIGDGSTAMVTEYFGTGSGHSRVIDVSTGDVRSEWDVDVVAYASVASPDGSTVAMAGTTGEIVTLDVSTGEQRRSTDLGAEVLWLKYSDDGELLVSGAEDGGVSLWDAGALDLLGTVYPPHRGKAVPAGAQFIGDSHDVAIASYDGKVYRWEPDLERAIDFACQMAGRSLTEDEWERFLPAQPHREVCPGQ